MEDGAHCCASQLRKPRLKIGRGGESGYALHLGRYLANGHFTQKQMHIVAATG